MYLPAQWLRNIVKVLSFRFQQCFDPFAIFSVEQSFETRLFKHLSNNVFRSWYFHKYISYEGHLFWQMFKIWSRFGKCKKNWEKFFCFWDTCIWIRSVKLSLLSTSCLSSEVNVLRNSLRILYITKRVFFQRNYLQSD